MEIINAIDIKKRKLSFELSKRKPNKFVVRRLKDSINRHEKQMKKYNGWKKRYNKRRNK